MPKPVDSARLRRWADELDAEERDELAASTQEKLDRLTDEEHTLTAEDVAWIRKLKTDLAKEDEEDAAAEAKAAEEKAARKAKPKPEAEEKPAEEEKPKRTRPGRKQGQLYPWWVGEDGEVYKLDIPRLYSDGDEDDEVEIPEKAEEEATA